MKNLLILSLALFFSIQVFPQNNNCFRDLNLTDLKSRFYNGSAKSPGFKNVSKPTIILIYAEWCSPSNKYKKELLKFASRHKEFDYYSFGEKKNDTDGNNKKRLFIKNILKCNYYPLTIVLRPHKDYFAFIGGENMDNLEILMDPRSSQNNIFLNPDISFFFLFGKTNFFIENEKNSEKGYGAITSGSSIFLGEIRNRKKYNGVLFSSNKINKKRVYYKNGMLLEKPKFEIFKGNYGKKGLKYCNDTTVFFPAIFDDLYCVQTGTAEQIFGKNGTMVVKYKGKYGIISDCKYFIIPCEYSYLGSFSEGAAYFEKKTSEKTISGFFNYYGETLFSYSGKSGIGPSSFKEGKALINIGGMLSSKYIFVNKHGDNIFG
ncbi:MAG: hypothetical protein LKI53_09320, partial [Bacteroidales bacterium]|nr:hypothetical protein [Bacteroidales bacterium]